LKKLKRFLTHLNKELPTVLPAFAGCKDTIFISYYPKVFLTFFLIIFPNQSMNLLVVSGCKSRNLFRTSKPFYNLFLIYFSFRLKPRSYKPKIFFKPFAS
ncbi:hypothetical protein, partial [Flavobacterium sp.]|uniref:hypothetical protein n=1 Tax=Flavobacterium sp. TaxID=239 RepID=UPI0037BF4A53